MMKQILALFVALAAVALAYPQHGHDHGHGTLGHHVEHNHGGGGGHHEFFAFTGHHGGHGGDNGHIDHHHATSYSNQERHDGHDHEVHIKAHPEYHYGFHVSDDKHKDYKTKHEERDGHKVKGSYTLVEPDGKTVRRVDYTADKKEGFNAKVTYQHHH